MKTTIAITKDLRDVIKLGATYRKMTIEDYLQKLVYEDLDMETLLKPVVD